MALRGQLASAPHVLGRDPRFAEKVPSGDQPVMRNDVAVLERKDVEGTEELLALEGQRHRQPGAAPRRHERRAAGQIVEGQPFDEGDGVYGPRRRRGVVQAVGCDGFQPGAEHPGEIGRQRG